MMFSRTLCFRTHIFKVHAKEVTVEPTRCFLCTRPSPLCPSVLTHLDILLTNLSRMHLLLFRLKTIGWDELPEGVLVCRHLPPTASPEQTTLPCSCVCLERQSRAPGEGSQLQKPLSCVPFRNNVFELAAGQRQVLQGQTFSGAPL